MRDDETPVRVGLVGAGQWAAQMHAPLHAAPGPTQLVGIWARDADRAAALATRHRVRAFARYADLLAEVEAVDFAVPPAVQARLGREAAYAGKALMLEKPLAADLSGAEELVAAIEARGVPTLVAMTRRYDATTREFLRLAGDARGGGLVAACGAFAHGGLLPGGFVGQKERSGWRSDLGVLFDLGPHLIDVVDAAAGTITAVRAEELPGEVVCVQTTHEGGALGQLLLSGRVRVETSIFSVDLLGHDGRHQLDAGAVDVSALRATMRREFADAVRRGAPPTVDARRALHVQRVLTACVHSLARGGAPELINPSQSGD